MPKTVAGRKEPIPFGLQGLEHLFRIRNECMRRAPCRSKSVLEGLYGFCRIPNGGNEFLRIQVHHFSYRMQTTLGLREEPTTYLKERTEVLRMFRQGRLKGFSTTRNVIEERVIYIDKYGTILLQIKKEPRNVVLLSGRRDSNSRPPAPKAGILTGLNYYPLGLAELVVIVRAIQDKNYYRAHATSEKACKITTFF